MMDYIAVIEGDYYEGNDNNLRIMNPRPMVLPLVVMGNSNQEVGSIVFIEDYFNSAARIRRGRVYIPGIQNSWYKGMISPLPPIFRAQSIANQNVNQVKAQVSYMSLNSSVMPTGTEVLLGQKGSQSSWSVVLAEQDLSSGLVLTLKAKTFLGVLPDVDASALPDNNRQDILYALDAVVETASTQDPQAAVEASKNAVYELVLAKYPQSITRVADELGVMAKWLCNNVDEHGNKMQSRGTAVDIVNKLHSRGKANAAKARNTRPLSLEDANLAVSAVAFLLQDFGWAESRVL